MKAAEVRKSLAHFAEKLDMQWAYSKMIADAKANAGLVAYDENGDPIPTKEQIAYHGMTEAFEAMGGEWSRKVDGHHRLCLFGVFVETYPEEEGDNA